MATPQSSNFWNRLYALARALSGIWAVLVLVWFLVLAVENRGTQFFALFVFAILIGMAPYVVARIVRWLAVGRE